MCECNILNCSKRAFFSVSTRLKYGKRKLKSCGQMRTSHIASWRQKDSTLFVSRMILKSMSKRWTILKHTRQTLNFPLPESFYALICASHLYKLSKNCIHSFQGYDVFLHGIEFAFESASIHLSIPWVTSLNTLSSHDTPTRRYCSFVTPKHSILIV